MSHLRQISLRFLEVLGSLTLLGLLALAATWFYVNALTPMTELEKLQRAAARGDAVAQYELGLSYREGHRVEKGLYWVVYHHEDERIKKNYEKAANWIRKAAEQGYARAQYELGFSYGLGWWGVPQDDDKALKWTRKAADQGNPLALYRLGSNYEHGIRGFPEDKSKALKLYRQAGKADGFYSSHEERSQHYHSMLAQHYYKQAQQGDVEAQYKLGRLFRRGSGVPKDAGKALKWLRRAAEQGHAGAQYSLGKMLILDKISSAKWFILAIKGEGMTAALASLALDDLKPKMTPAQIEVAKEAAQKWRKEHEE